MADEAALLDLALSGDEAAFTAIVAPLQRELHVHCYRMLGSFDDADDALQETLLAAWRGLRSFEKRATVRTWLYRIATNTCLNLVRAAARRPPQALHLPGFAVEANAHTEITWLQPYPDVLLDEIAADAPGPQDLAERSDSLSLAFTAAIQALTPRARAVLVLRDVLGFTAAETAAILESTQDAVAMTLSRARAALRDARLSAKSRPARAEDSAKLAQAFATALAARDIDAVVRLLADDVRFSMPPVPAVWQGRERATAFLSRVVFRLVREALFVPVGANRQPTLAVYARDLPSGAWRANGLLVITTRATGEGYEIAAVTRFDASRLRAFGLPGVLAG
jgi:RNA polymerase sigma-70 factor, ECF subfamily